LHFSFKLGVTITLLPYLARNLKFDKKIEKTLMIFGIATKAMTYTMHVG